MSENFKRYLNMYEWEAILPGSGQTVKFKPITTGQIKRLLLYSDTDDPITVENALDTLISECVITEGFNIKDQYLQDRFYLMLEIRNATKGFKYTFPSNCEKCNSQSFQTIDLNKLVVKKLNKIIEKVVPVVKTPAKKKARLELVEPVKNAPVVKTPVKEEKELPWNHLKINDNIAVTLTFLTRGMQEYIMDLLKDVDITDEQKIAEMNILGYAIIIESIITPDGIETDLSLENKVFFIENLPQMEKEKIDEWITKNDFGVEFKFKVKCIHCKDETERVIPLDNFFY